MVSSTRPDIPTDIWLYISYFIPHKELRDLYSVNSTFLQLALNERYQDVDFLQVNPRTLRFLEHVRDPNIASRVRRLRVNPVWFKLHASSVKTSLPNRSNIMRRIKSEFERRLDFTNRMANAKQQRETIDALTISVVNLFPNITSFVIVTRYFPHPHSLPHFLFNSWRTFGSNLTRLTINAPLGGFEPLLPSTAELTSLQELTLRFSTDMTSGDEALDTHTLNHTIAPFLRTLAPKLRRLNIMSSALGDHSGLFGALGHFPRLTALSLDIGFYPPLLVDPAGLTDFLRRNTPSLKHVRFQPHESFRSPSILGPAYNHFSQWMAGNAEDIELLGGLQSLVISPSTDLSASANLDTAGVYVLRSRDTLTSLVLGDRCLSFADLKALVGVFAHRPANSGLKTLYVKVISLNPQLFDLLAEKLPGLDDLDIKFNCLLADVEEERPCPSDDKAPGKSDIEAFLKQMSGRIYSQWSLYALWIWQRSHMTTKTAQDILNSLKGSIPSVRVVCRMDHSHHLNTIFN
ncbi:hypothetical protein BDZ94DRAFT_1318071 [Collybia nuda]|uniref:F-box domain-containing protein n=1 Tax=Collybia nuda TaxID=64659 RepID=A0A9P5YEC2_9AGAR|nr:hypothetical protein BDZ94DRAFT_1318071 [Collybia nuda]